MNALTCRLCGVTSLDVRESLVAWADLTDHEMFGFIPRCRDRVACRARVEADGETWPVRDPREKART